MAKHNRTAHGCTITFASGFTAEIIDITPPNQTLADIKTSHNETEDGFHTYVPADLIENGQLSFDIAFEPEANIPEEAAPEIITVAIPGVADDSFTGYINGVQPRTPMEDRMTATISVKVTGPIT